MYFDTDIIDNSYSYLFFNFFFYGLYLSRGHIFGVTKANSLAGNPMRTWFEKALKSEELLGKGRPGFSVNVQ